LETDPQPVKKWEELGLSPSILWAIHQLGFKHPTPIQAQVIPAALQGQDIIGLAETGSGKTAAFAIPIASRLTHRRETSGRSHAPSGLILCPTREIALQTKAFLDLFGKHHHLETACLIGGVRMNPQIRDLDRGPDIIVATPGRLADHIGRRTADVSKIRELVLDEADRMLDMGFLPQIQEIIQRVPRERQTLMFSATMPPTIESLAQRYLKNPQKIDILPEGKAPEGITHQLYLVAPEQKRACLLGLMHLVQGSTIVFTRTKLDANWLCGVLEKEGHPVTKIHSNRTQRERVEALAGFREGEHRILVATSIAARGLDIPAIQHIINFEMPDSVEEYIHRAGRTARIGALGTVSTIGTGLDKPMVRQIEAALGKELPRCSVPGVPAYQELKVKPFGRLRRGGRRR